MKRINIDVRAFATKLAGQFDRQAFTAAERAANANETSLAYEVSDKFDVQFAPVYAVRAARADISAKRSGAIATTHRENLDAKVFHAPAPLSDEEKKELHDDRMSALNERGEARKVAFANLSRKARGFLRAALLRAASEASNGTNVPEPVNS